MTGEKKRPLMIGKSHKPRCLKNIRTYPVDYRSQNSSWMTADIYSRWLARWDEHLRARKRRILLLHDNFSDKNWVGFSAPQYNGQDCFKKSNLEPYRGMISEFEDNEEEITFNIPYDPELIQKWIEIDKDLETSAPTTEDEIIDEIQGKERPEENEDEESDDDIEFENDSVVRKPVSVAEARAAIECLNQFVLETDTEDREMNLHLQYKTFIQSKTDQKLKQCTIDRFFK